MATSTTGIKAWEAASERESLEDTAGCVGKVFYSDYKALMATAAAGQTIQESQLHGQPAHMRASALLGRFAAAWELQKDAMGGTEGASGLAKPLAKALGTMARRDVRLYVVMTFIGGLLPFLNPLLMEAVLGSLTDGEAEHGIRNGIIYSVGLLLVGAITILVEVTVSRTGYRIGTSFVGGLLTGLYDHTLKLSNNARLQASTGELLNFLASDTHAVFQAISTSRLMWTAPVQITLALVLLFQQVGHAMWGGLAVMILSIPVNGAIAGKYGIIHGKKLKLIDARLKTMTDALSAIKLVKYNAWEPSFMRRVNDVRTGEVKLIREYNLTTAKLMLSIGTLPVMVALATFALYAYLAGENGEEVQVSTFFVTLSLLQLLQFPLFGLPMALSLSASAAVSLRRLSRFLCLPTAAPAEDPRTRGDALPEGVVIQVVDGQFHWSKPAAAGAAATEAKATNVATMGSKPTETADGSAVDDDDASQDAEHVMRGGLTDVNLDVKAGELVVVVGRLGSGKSSLLSALTGEMPGTDGTVGVRGRVGVVPQRPFILHASVRDNIVMDRPWDKAHYAAVTAACCLEPDFDMLPDGDNTIIGERGLNLSGGQQARVSLARAVYDKSDVVLLDDILASVDAHVASAIMERVVLGLLADRARVLVTNQLRLVVHHADKVVFLQAGTIAEQGSFTELMRANGAFARLMRDFGGQAEEGEEAAAVPERLTEGAMRSTPEPTVDAAAVKDDVPGAAAEADAAGAAESKGEAAARGTSGATKAGTGKELVTVEERAEGSIGGATYTHLYRAFGSCYVRSYLTLLIIAYCATAGSSFWLSIWSDPGNYLSAEDAATLGTGFYIGVYAAWIGGAALLTYAKEVAFAFGAMRAARTLHDKLLERVLGAPLSWFDVTPLGRIINRFSKDVATVDGDLPYYINHVFTASMAAVGLIILSTLSTLWLVPVSIPAIYIYFRLLQRYRAAARDLQRLENVSRSPVFAFITETIDGLVSVRAFGWENDFLKTHLLNIDTNLRAFYLSKAAVGWMMVRANTIGAVLAGGIALFVVLTTDARPDVEGFLPVSVAGLALALGMGLTQTLNGVSFLTGEMDTRMTSLERMVSYMDSVPSEEEERAAVSAQLAKREGRAPPAMLPNEGWQANGRIEFDRVEMRYRPGLPLVLRGVSFSVPRAGTKLAICGRTGSGKSSVINALLNTRPLAGGRILIGGEDTAAMPVVQLRAQISVVPQDPVLFEGTLRFNLDPFSKHTDSQLADALKLVELQELSLDEHIQEGGRNFSVGQRQLLCVCRALLRETSILLLDEATSATDAESDAAIQRLIREQFKGATVVTIAHRIDTILDYDRVLVLQDGQVVEDGAPAVLMGAENGHFAALVKSAASEGS